MRLINAEYNLLTNSIDLTITYSELIVTKPRRV